MKSYIILREPRNDRSVKDLNAQIQPTDLVSRYWRVSKVGVEDKEIGVLAVVMTRNAKRKRCAHVKRTWTSSKFMVRKDAVER